MAKVAMMESGLRRKQTYEDIIDYIENDPDKIQYPNRAAKYLRNTFQLSQLDGMGQALLEQQEINEMAERVKYYQLKELADQNETSKIIEDAKNTSPQPITEQPASSSGSRSGGVIPGIGSVVGGVASGVGSMVRGAVNVASYAGSLLPTSLDEDAEQHENEEISNRIEQQSSRRQREKGYMRDVHDHLDEVRQQQERHLPVLPAFPVQSPAPSSSYGSVAPLSPAPTQFYIGDSAPATPSRTIKSSPLSVRSSPNTIQSSPQVIQSSPETIRSSSSIEGPFGARSSSSQPRARTEGEIRDERRRKKFGY